MPTLYAFRRPQNVRQRYKNFTIRLRCENFYFTNNFLLITCAF